MSGFFLLYYLKSVTNLMSIFIYFFIIPIIPLDNFFHNKDCCQCH